MVALARELGGRRRAGELSRYPQVLAALGAGELRALGDSTGQDLVAQVSESFIRETGPLLITLRDAFDADDAFADDFDDAVVEVEVEVEVEAEPAPVPKATATKTRRAGEEDEEILQTRVSTRTSAEASITHVVLTPNNAAAWKINQLRALRVTPTELETLGRIMLDTRSGSVEELVARARG